MKRLPAGRVYAQFVAGASIADLSRQFDVTADVVEAALRRQLRAIARRAAALACVVFFVACGVEREPIVIAPPTTGAACKAAFECEAVTDVDACVRCIEGSGVAPQWNARLFELYGDSPPDLELVPCGVLVAIADETNLAACVVGRWYKR